ncbi:MAG: hypothetical protein ABJA02_08520 [Acidobacteriota bacterium]
MPVFIGPFVPKIAINSRSWVVLLPLKSTGCTGFSGAETLLAEKRIVTNNNMSCCSPDPRLVVSKGLTDYPTVFRSLEGLIPPFHFVS